MIETQAASLGLRREGETLWGRSGGHVGWVGVGGLGGKGGVQCVPLMLRTASVYPTAHPSSQPSSHPFFQPIVSFQGGVTAHVGSLLVSWWDISASYFPLSSCYTFIAVTKFTNPHWGTPVSVISQVCMCVCVFCLSVRPKTPSSSVSQVPLYVEFYLPGLPWGRISS